MNKTSRHLSPPSPPTQEPVCWYLNLTQPPCHYPRTPWLPTSSLDMPRYSDPLFSSCPFTASCFTSSCFSLKQALPSGCLSIVFCPLSQFIGFGCGFFGGCYLKDWGTGLRITSWAWIYSSSQKRGTSAKSDSTRRLAQMSSLNSETVLSYLLWGSLEREVWILPSGPRPRGRIWCACAVATI